MRAAACAAAALFLASPALAQDTLETYPRRTFGNWSVYGFQGDCWMVNETAGGASISFSTSSRDTDLYIAVGDPAWTNIAKNADLAVRVSFARFDANRRAIGLPVGGRGFSLFLGDAADSHLAALRAAPHIRFTAPDIALEVPLAGAGPAFDHMRQCTGDIRK